MLAAGRRIAVAVSGGADSVCLLHLLHELGLATRVLHVNHHLRGTESDADATFVAARADHLHLPCELHDAPVPDSGNLEQEARNLRLAFFRSVIARGDADRVALGHTRSDQAETVLFRFLRGSGTAGLAGIRPVTRDGIIRPLIETDREEVRRWLRERGIDWREDSSNASPEFARNRIRTDLLPQLAREWNPAIAETLAQTAEWALAEEEYWDAEIGRLADQFIETSAFDGSVLLQTGALSQLPTASARRLVRRAMELAKGDLRAIGFGHVEEVLALAEGPEAARTQAPGLDICRSLNWVRFVRLNEGTGYRLPAAPPSRIPLPGTVLELSLELIDKSETIRTVDSVYNIVMGRLDWRRLSGSLELRNWQPGDRYRPVGCSGLEKVADLFQSARIPLWERERWPVLTDRSGIVWARRFGPAAGREATPESPTVLEIREVTPR
ncbi:MAG TPA: tRNA lysidine(34) synthetase TilS [Candidatus Solibacter sp.]|nr:tRNA lysidine(34) synthetase TilS [Candidatus Solibacter sp.]